MIYECEEVKVPEVDEEVPVKVKEVKESRHHVNPIF
jgi:hypothetical protein